VSCVTLVSVMISEPYPKTRVEGAPLRMAVLTGIFPSTPSSFRGNFVLDQVVALQERGCCIAIAVAQAFALPGSDRDRSRKIDLNSYRSMGLSIERYHYLNLPKNKLGPLSAPWMYLQLSNCLAGLIKEVDAQIIHAHNEHHGYVAVRLAKRLGLRSGVTLHGINAPWMFDTRRKGEQLGWTLEHADRVFLVGDAIAAHFSSYVQSRNNFRIVYNGHKLPLDIKPSVRLQRKATWRIIGVANLGETKGFQYVIRALANIEQANPGLMELVIVGGGVHECALRQLTADLQVSKIVYFTGELAHREALAEVAAADIFCLPSSNEAFGLAYVEAMALGKVAIACATQGPEAFITHGKTGFLVDPHSHESVEQVLLEAVSSSQLNEIRKAGQAYVTNNLRWEHNADQVIEAYNELA
jgi:teichuronic acid biosynthesis glycosyltransferase TuaC